MAMCVASVGVMMSTLISDGGVRPRINFHFPFLFGFVSRFSMFCARFLW